MPDGMGTLYPDPELAFVIRDQTFRQAAQYACAYVKGTVHLWPKQWDVRWGIKVQGRERLPATLMGDSAGAALALGLAKLAGTMTKGGKRTERLHALELERVALTAVLDPAGRLRAVGGLWEKLLAAAQEAGELGLLRTVVVAKEQRGVPEQMEQPDAFPLRIIRIATLDDAVKKLYEEHGPRAFVRRYEQQQRATMEILDRVVPIEKYYRTLPLLRAVPQERLLRASHSPRTEAPELRLHTGDIVRWEEELSHERITYERHTVEKVLSDFRKVMATAGSKVPRFIVLGPPGSGKTTLAKYLAWRAAQGSLHVRGQQLVPVYVQLRAWEAWAIRSKYPNADLPEYLTKWYKIPRAPSAEQWQQWFRRGEVLLLLDGLDEITAHPSFLATLKTTLTTFTMCPTVLTCRTVSFEQHKALCPDMPVFTLAGLEKAQRDAYIHNFPAAYPERFHPYALIEQLDRTPQLHPLATNPLLLSILCYVVDDVEGVTLPATRGELYEKAVEKLLTRPQRVKVRYPGHEPDIDEKKAILERTALALFVKGGRSLTFTSRELGQELKKALRAEGYDRDPAPWANALRVDLTHNSGILRGSTKHGYFFLHLTVQEFLVAAALARVANEQGWEADIAVTGKQSRVSHLVDCKGWDPRWQEVIVLMAGQLQDPRPLLNLLADENTDDVFRHRLTLAVACLPALKATAHHALSTLMDHLTTCAFSLWWQHQVRYTEAAVPHLTRTLPALGEVQRQLVGAPLLEGLCQRLHEGNKRTRLCAAQALGLMGSAVAHHPGVLSALLYGVLHDKDERVRRSAAQALGQIGGAAAQHPEVLPALLDALGNPGAGGRVEAAQALGLMGWTAMQHAEVLPALLAALRDGDKRVRGEATLALGQIGAVAQHSEVLPVLLDALRGVDKDIRMYAVQALGQMGDTAVQHAEVLPALLAALRDEDERVRGEAAKALGRMRSDTVQHAEVLPALLAALRDGHQEVRDEAALALGQTAETAMQYPEVLPALLEGLRDTDEEIRAAAVFALALMGDAVPYHAEVLLALLNIVQCDPDEFTREGAEWALGQLGEIAMQHPEVLPALLEGLDSTDAFVRRHAAQALGQFEEAVTYHAQHPEVLSALLHVVLHDTDEAVRRQAAVALGRIGGTAAHHKEVLLMLLNILLHSTEIFLLWDAVCVLGGLGEAAVQHPEMFSTLLRALRRAKGYVREGVAHVLGWLMAQGVRIFAEGRGRWAWRHIG
jgi:HEAT repeat protein